MAGLIYAPNQFDPSDGRIYKTVLDGSAIGDIIADYAQEGLELDVIINGRRVTNLNYKVRKEDHITIAVHIGKDSNSGGKQVLRMVAMIIVVVIATYLVGPAGGGVAEGLEAAGWGATAATVGGYVAFGAIMVAGTLLVNAILPPSKLNIGGMGTDQVQDGNTYGWNPSRNQINEGLVAPVLYGKMRITPQIISQYRSYIANKDIINVLFHLTEGESSLIENLKVNNIAIADVSVDGVPDFVYHQGTMTQAVIPDFGNSIFEIPVGQALNGTEVDGNVESEITVTTNGNAVENLAVGIVLTGGLYAYTQGYSELITGYRIEFRINGSGDPWTPFSGQSGSLTRNVYGDYYEPAGYWVTPHGLYSDPKMHGYYARQVHFATYADALASNTGEPWEPSIPVAGFHDVVDVRTEGVGFYHSDKSPDTMKFLHTHNVSLPANKYDIRVVRLIQFPVISGSTSYANNVAVSFIQEITLGSFTYPYTSLLGLSSVATEKIYGGSPIVSMDLTRGNLSHYAGEYGVGSPTLHDSGNPAWACYDLLTNPMYGAGVDPTQIILADFEAWATFCDSKSLRANIYFDVSGNVFDICNQISVLGYGSVVPRGTSIGCVFEDTSAMVYTFGMGNIIEGTFNMYYVDRQNRANVVEVTYFDEDLEYDRRILLVRNGAVENDSDVVAQISLVGCTNREQARKHANRLILSNKYNIRVVEFQADIDAIHCQNGDVIGVSHDVPQYGYSGRTFDSTSNTIVLGTAIYLESAKTYSILIRHEDDTLESKNIASPVSDGDYSTLTLDAGTWGTNPAYMSTWNLAEVATGIKKFRVLSISKSGDFIAKIKAMEYREEILTDGAVIPDYPVDTLLESVIGLGAYVNFKKETDGAIKAEIRVDWRGVSTEWRVNVSRSDGYTMPAWNTYVTRSDFIISNILPRATDTYTITVTGLDGDTATTTVDMIIDPPVQVDGIQVNVIDQFVMANWETPFSEAKIKHYEIWKGTDFMESTYVGSSTSNFISFQEPDYGQQTYWIFAVNEFDGKGIPVKFQATIEGDPNYEALLSFTIDGSGSGTDFYVDGEYILGPIGNTTTTWEDAIMDLYPVDYATKTMDDLVADFGYATIIDVLGATSDGYGDYSEVIDLGAEYPKAEYRLSVKKISGTGTSGKVDVTTTIMLSNDNITYYQDVGSLNQIGLGVRYIRVYMVFLGDSNTAIWARPQIDILTKTIQQTGKVAITDANAGLTIQFTVPFVDVNGIVITPKSTLPRYPVYDFNDVPNPTDFTVWLFDETGTKVTGSFNYIVTGI